REAYVTEAGGGTTATANRSLTTAQQRDEQRCERGVFRYEITNEYRAELLNLRLFHFNSGTSLQRGFGNASDAGAPNRWPRARRDRSELGGTMSDAHNQALLGLLRKNETFKLKGYSLAYRPANGIVIDRA